MSKSLGNFFLVKDILAHYPPEVLRFFILSTHYRSPLNFSDEQLAEAGRGLERLRTAVDNMKYLASTTVERGASDASQALLAAAAQARADFDAAMDDDFNTALAISVMHGLAKEINIYYSAVMAGKAPVAGEAIASVQATYYEMADILGLLVAERMGAADVVGAAPEGSADAASLLDLIVEIRQEARKKKDWATADRIRDRLGELGYIIEDSPQGARWKKREV